MNDDRDSKWWAPLFVGLQYLLPQHLLSRLMYRLARLEAAPFPWFSIRAFVRLNCVDLSEAEHSDPSDYPSLAAFFTRALRPGVRPLDPDPAAVISPVDGKISQLGTIHGGHLIQAKWHDYTVGDLLDGETAVSRQFDGGTFATIYLSPRDYHRVHMPLAGDLTEMSYAGGRLFSVNRMTAELVPGLFARNERVMSLFDTEVGPMAMVLVGAIFVGGIETVWAGEVTPAMPGVWSRRHNYRIDSPHVRLERGEEMGRFNLGSTVILLFPPGAVTWDESLTPGDEVRMGQRIGTRR
jgi:phosphatidylserine decarboxylase